MRKALNTIFICSLLSMGLHLYLSDRSYSLSSDQVSATAICNINDSLNCDSTLSSRYSKVAGLPISNLGFGLNLILALLSLMVLISWTEKISLVGLTILTLSGVSALTSIGMLAISVLFMASFCPFCIILYLLSFIILGCIIFCIKTSSSPFSFSFSQIPALLKNSAGFLPSFFLIGVAASLILHLIFIRMYGIESMGKNIKYAVMDWSSSPVKPLSAKPLFTIGPSAEKAKVTVTEFADFLCSHCQNSYYTLKVLKNSQPDVRIEFFSFPLDRCKTERASCFLTKATYCAEKQEQGWNVHGIIFENQKKFISVRGEEASLKLLTSLTENVNLNRDDWEKCIRSPAALQFTHKQLEAGESIKINGTPTILVNKKKIANQYLNESIKIIKKRFK